MPGKKDWEKSGQAAGGNRRGTWLLECSACKGEISLEGDVLYGLPDGGNASTVEVGKLTLAGI